MFGRDKAQAQATATATAPPPLVKEGGKGHATPKRKEAQARNRTPVVGASTALPKGATRAERKAARAARTAKNRDDRLRTRQALASGDERYLPVRDKGPARKFVRDWVDARRNLGEFFLPVAALGVVLQFSQVYALQALAILLLYGLVLAIVVDSFFLYRGMKKRVTDKFGEEHVRGIGTYAITRALQIRRARSPKPQVARGAFPA